MSPYLLLPLIALASNLGLAVLTLRGQWQARGHHSFALFLLSMASWGGLLFMMRASPTLSQAFFWEKLVVVDVALISVLYLHFTYGFSRRASAAWVLPVAYGLFGLVTVLTLLGTTVTAMQLKSYGFAPLLGPAFGLFIVFTYGAIIMGVLNMWHASKFGESVALRNRAGYILVGTSASLVGGTTDILPVIGLPVYPLGIVGNIMFAILATVAMQKVRLLDIRLALRRAFAYAVLAAGVAVAYLALGYALEYGTGLADTRATVLFAVVFAAGAVVAIPKMNDRIQHWVDRTFLGNRYSSLKALERFSGEMKDISDRRALSSSLVSQVKGATGAEFVVLLEPGQDRNRFSTAAAIGTEERFSLPYESGASAIGRLSSQDRVATAEEVSLFPEWQVMPERDRAPFEAAEAKLFVPIKSQSELVGVLVLGPRESGVYSQEEMDLLRTAANQAATAMESARLYNELASQLEHNERRVAAFEHAAGRMALEENPDLAIEQLISEVMELIDARYGAVAVWGPNGDLTRVIGPGIGRADGSDRPGRWVPTLMETVGMAGFDGDDADSGNGTEALAGLAVPFKCKDSGRGVIYLREKASGRGFTEADERLTNLFAALIGVLINNVEVYKSESRERSTLTAIQASMTEGLAVLDQDGRVLYFNHAAELHWSLSASSVVGRGFIEAIGEHAQDLEDAETALKELTELVEGSGESNTAELALVRPDRRDLALTAFPISTEMGNDMTGILVRDATEERDLDRRRDTFVSVACHELRTPMTTILGFTELLLDDITEGDSRRWLEHVHEDSLRLTTILDDMLDVSRIQSGRLRMTIERIDVREVIDDVLARIGSTTDNHTFEVDVAPGTPKALTDQAKTTQIVLNLVSNAIKYSPEGGTIRISTALSRSGEEVVVAITDEGIGIAPEDVDQVFETCYRVKNEQTYEIRGTGLGLYIVKSLVEGIGGTMSVESEVDKGSTFTFTMPAAPSGSWIARKEVYDEQSVIGR